MRVFLISLAATFAAIPAAWAFTMSSEEKAAMISSCTQGQVESGETYEVAQHMCSCATEIVLPQLSDEEAHALAGTGQTGAMPPSSVVQKVLAAQETCQQR